MANLSKQEQASLSRQGPATLLLQVPKVPSGANDEFKHWNAPLGEPQAHSEKRCSMDKGKHKSAEKVRDSLGGLLAGAAGPGLIKVTLLGIATKAATSWIKNATSTAVASGAPGPRPQTGRGSIISPRVDT